MTASDASRTCSDIIQARDCGVTRCVVCETEPPLTGLTDDARLPAPFDSDLTPLLDAFATQHGLKPLGEAWHEVNDETARWILQRLLSHDLAYRSEIMSEAKARSLSHAWLAVCAAVSCAERLRYFTNGSAVDGPPIYDLAMRRLDGWMPATDTTLDTGIVVVTRQRIGLVWVADED